MTVQGRPVKLPGLVAIASPRAIPPSEQRPCPVCGETRAYALHTRERRRVLRCPCGVVFVDPLPSETEIATHESDAFREGLVEETREMFEAYGRGESDQITRSKQAQASSPTAAG